MNVYQLGTVAAVVIALLFGYLVVSAVSPRFRDWSNRQMQKSDRRTEEMWEERKK